MKSESFCFRLLSLYRQNDLKSMPKYGIIIKKLDGKIVEKQGEVYIGEDNIPYKFDTENGKLKLFFGLRIVKCDNCTQKLIGKSLNKGICFFLSLPLTSCIKANSEQQYFCGNATVDVDYYIEDFVQGIKYNTMYFEFSELDNLLPSKTAAICDANAKQWKFEEKCIKDFDFTVMDNTVKFGLFNSYSINGDLAYEINTKSYIKLSFEETDDFLFLSILFRKIKELFMLIYDRQNINLFSVDLFGAPNQVRNDGSQTARPKQVMCFVERHSEKVESEVNLKKQRIRYNTISSHFIELFEMILKDEVLVYNLHASLNARSLIDLKQSIQIASSFEHYQRTFTPEISSEDSIEVYGKIRQLVFEEAKKYTGKNKKTVENIAKRIIPTQSLKDVLCKVYKGYKEWRGLASILGEWFKAKEVPQLAQTINDWRNELAHANCKFVPTRDVITAVRLLECVNYCIIFRCAGYDDMEIKTYIEDAALLR